MLNSTVSKQLTESVCVKNHYPYKVDPNYFRLQNKKNVFCSNRIKSWVYELNVSLSCICHQVANNHHPAICQGTVAVPKELQENYRTNKLFLNKPMTYMNKFSYELQYDRIV